jgi:hypothetical protein
MLRGATIQMSESEPLTTIEVTLSRVIEESGRMAVKIKTPTSYNVVEILGLLEAAKWYIYSEMGRQDD